MSEPHDALPESHEGHVPPGRVQVRDVPENARPYKWKPGQSGNPAGRSGLYGECRRLAAEASPSAMRRLIELMDAQDERVAYMAAVAVLDRAGVKPKEYDPREEQQALSRLPLEERKVRLAELVGRAEELLARSSNPIGPRRENPAETANRPSR
jgi:hypothetical protein